MAFPVGMLVVLLAAVGLVTLVVGAVKGIDTAVERRNSYSEYNRLLTPVVLIDPDPFDDITGADMSQLIEISVWSLLKSDISPDKYAGSDSGLAIPKADVEAEFVKLFGTQITPVHASVEGYGYEFAYDEEKGVYTVPLTGIVPLYTPMVVDKSTSSGSVTLTVACLAGEAWEQGEDGKMIEPAPDKYLKITLRETEGGVYISSIQNTSSPEVATTAPATAAPTTENRDLLAQAEQVAGESTTESAGESAEAPSAEGESPSSADE